MNVTSSLCRFCEKRPAKKNYEASSGVILALCGRCHYWPDGRLAEAAHRVSIGLPAEPAKMPSTRFLTQHTRVYFVQSVNGGPIKIGWAESPRVRLVELQAGNPEQLDIIGAIRGGHAKEAELHRRFKNLRIRGEWFRDSEELLLFIERECTEGGAL